MLFAVLRRRAPPPITKHPHPMARGGTADLESAVTPRTRALAGSAVTPRKPALKRIPSAGAAISMQATPAMPPALANTLAAVEALKLDREDRARRAAEQAAFRQDRARRAAEEAAIRFVLSNNPARPAELSGGARYAPRRPSRVYFDPAGTGSTHSSEILPSGEVSPRSAAASQRSHFSQRSQRSHQSRRVSAGAAAGSVAGSGTGSRRGKGPAAGLSAGALRPTEQVQRARAALDPSSPRRHHSSKLVSEFVRGGGGVSHMAGQRDAVQVCWEQKYGLAAAGWCLSVPVRHDVSMGIRCMRLASILCKVPTSSLPSSCVLCWLCPPDAALCRCHLSLQSNLRRDSSSTTSSHLGRSNSAPQELVRSALTTSWVMRDGELPTSKLLRE